MDSAVETLCGQAYGAETYEMLGVYLQRSTVLLMATGVPLAVMCAFSEPLLLLLGQSPEIAGAAAEFAYGLIPQIFAYAANFPIQKFLQAQSIVAPSAWILATAFALQLPRDGPAGGLAHAQRHVVGPRRRPVRVHPVEPAVQADVDRIHVGHLRRPARVRRPVRRLRRHAGARGVVLPGAHPASPDAAGPAGRARLANCLVSTHRPAAMGVLLLLNYVLIDVLAPHI
jgi:hypothetical protein